MGFHSQFVIRFIITYENQLPFCIQVHGELDAFLKPQEVTQRPSLRKKLQETD